MEEIAAYPDTYDLTPSFDAGTVVTVTDADYSYDWTVGLVEFHGTASNLGTVDGNAQFNDTSTNVGTVTGKADVYYPVVKPLGGIVLGVITYYNYPPPPNPTPEPSPAKVDYATVSNDGTLVSNIVTQMTAMQTPPDVITRVITYLYEHPEVMRSLVNMPVQEGIRVVIENSKVYIAG
jgi:hypothetical protein